MSDVTIRVYHSQLAMIREKVGNSDLFGDYRNRDKDPDYVYTIRVDEIISRPKTLEAFKEVLSTDTTQGKTHMAKAALRGIENYLSLLNNANDKVVKNLKELQTVIKSAFEKAANQMILIMDRETGRYSHYKYSDCKYEYARREDPEHLTITLLYFDFDSFEKRSVKKNYISLYYDNSFDVVSETKIKKKKTSDDDEDEDDYSHTMKKRETTLTKVMIKNNLIIANEKHVEEYEDGLAKLIKLEGMTGQQFLAEGKGYRNVHSYGGGLYGVYNLVNGENNNKVIIDYETRIPVTAEDPLVPTRLNVRCYDITAHCQMITNIHNLTEYVYNPKIKENLILPKISIDLLDVLIDTDVDLMEDIISGKKGGIIVLATGAPGLGKTLTAECYSEIMQRPLYIVQSSQLGIKVEDMEKNLNNVLNRAQRWGAILMIDEADTYIHKRGTDIVQNCIVGVFLRLLEYYSGVLFMTSNLPDVVDDAILSRCTAHIHYDIPTEDDSRSIWAIQLKLNKIECAKEGVEAIISKYSMLGGRDIKNMCKMVRMYILKNPSEKFGIELFEKLLPFMNFAQKVKDHGKSGRTRRMRRTYID